LITKLRNETIATEECWNVF